ncbi:MULTISPECIES: glycerophosphodiester phosphodiesterase family protein [Streptacidiphilus]|uniref:Glycerophosphodiester phosphodiesterase family protein n=1 Tax=Streptacidiphilus cavernicola TaxID=3342716 RepID=A0ABV6UGR0_9ACTN|nr:glycerophosphodiester phosphodiesterase family protein [Streptacidiphilus jeojiense]
MPNRAATRVVAHRGASGTLAEHTLAAYKLAVDEGADALECDVRLTADGHLVCVHDRRVDRTSNGRGVVSTLELAQLSELDFGSWKAARAATGTADADDTGADTDADADEADWADAEHTSVLTLERLLEFATGCGRRIELAIETKHPTRYAGLVERRLLELLHRFDLVTPADGERTPVRIMSFSQLSLRRVRELAPAIPTVFLMERVPLRFRDGTLPHGARIAGPGIDLVRANPGYVAALHRAGHRVHVWTVDDPEDVELCLRLGVDTIITNHPRRVLDQLGR